MVNILITGATGYIGGDALFALLQAHPELESNITALARNPDRASVIAKVYPKIKFTYGSLDDSAVLEKAASEADVVLHFADCDHTGAANALVAGLSARVANSLPAYIIHTSGTGILTYEDLASGKVGEPSEKMHDDWDNVHEVTSLPDSAWHRPVDKIILAAGTTGVNTAIVAPPTIYDTGRGPGNTRSIQWNKMASCTLKRGKGFHVGKGENKWTYINISDLSALYLSLTEAALAGNRDPQVFGSNGYFFCEAGEYLWRDAAGNIARAAHKAGFLETAEVDSITKSEAEQLFEGGSSQWGLNSRCKAVRANKVFGWSSKGASPDKAMPAMIKAEAEAAGLVKRHAQIAAGN